MVARRIQHSTAAVLIFTAVGSTGITADSDALPRQLQKCQTIKNDTGRLACYDKLARQYNKVYITPDKKFLQSELRVNKKSSEYSLKVEKFAQLIAKARLENKKQVKVLGWQAQGNRYSLHILYRDMTKVEFVHYPQGKENFSVLQPVMVGDQKIDPAIFIFNIAAMAAE